MNTQNVDKITDTVVFVSLMISFTLIMKYVMKRS